MDYDAATALLVSPTTWCDGASELAKLQDPRALIALAKAYRSPHEASKLCLLDALEALHAGDHAADVYATDKISGLDLMRLFPDDAHLALLVSATDDPDAQTRFVALRAIASQKQTPAWIAAMIPLLAAERRDVRAKAIDALGRRDEPEVIAALRARRDVEPDEALKAQIAMIIGP